MIRVFFLFFLCFCLWVDGASLPDVPDEAKRQLGTTYGVPQMDGIVFIDGRYLPPPYSVSRKGNGIFINRIQIAQPVSWSTFSGESTVKKEGIADADGDFKEVEAAPKKPVTGESAPAAAVPATKSVDDLFAEDEEVEAKKPAAAVSQTAAQDAAVQVSKVDSSALKEQLRKNLDKMRLNYEKALGRNGIFLFSSSHALINGNSGVARTLIGVLPGALRAANSPEDLLVRLERGGVYFLDLPTANSLFRNRLMFPQLQERLDRIKLKESLDAVERRNRRAY